MSQLQALVCSNGIEGLASLYRSTERVQYRFVPVSTLSSQDFQNIDLFIAPNGTDHVALFRQRQHIHRFLDRGGMLFCFDGWFTDWIPGNRWVMDNTRKTIDIRYRIKEDREGLAQKFSVTDLSFSHQISGWWSCGYIQPAENAQILLVDTFERPLLVIDRTTTPGLMVLTASGPVGDYAYATTDDQKAMQAMSNLYEALLDLAFSFQKSKN